MAEYIDIDRYSFPTLHQKELNDYMKGWNSCLKSVLQQPIADVVEVKHGHWNDNIVQLTTVAGVKEDFVLGYKCSLCGRAEMLKEPYCNCGAKMDGERRDT